ncbi:hypothetical protein Tco_0270249 [Tanacetum coccineum]
MYAADGNQVTANAVQEYTIPPGEGCSVCGASFRAQVARFVVLPFAHSYLTIQDGDLETISLGILYTSFMVSSLFASSVVTNLGSKNALLLGTTGYLPNLLIMFAAKGFDSRLQLNVRELDFRVVAQIVGELKDDVSSSITVYTYSKRPTVTFILCPPSKGLFP